MHILRHLAALLLAGTASAQPPPPEAVVTPLMRTSLPEYPGREAVILDVVYPPGAVDPVHRHNAHAFVYVLHGSIVMGLRGRDPVVLAPGQTFYEGPGDVHTVGRNASVTEPARFLVVMLKSTDAPVLVPVP